MIIVGNLVAGGSGKTPLVLWIAEMLKARGYRPGIVSRGYGGLAAARGEAPQEVSASSDPTLVGDEPVLLSRRAECPVWVSADRVAACLSLRLAHPDCDVLVLDDGLQHYRLARDIEIAVVDARGFGNGCLFPAGPLREPVSRLATVDAVVSNLGSLSTDSADNPNKVDTPATGRYEMRLEGGRFVRLSSGTAGDAESLGAGRVHAVAGIGDPARFFKHLESLGLDVVPHPFPDHHVYAAAELEFGDQAPVVMTEKDAVKCTQFAAEHGRLWTLPVRAILTAGLDCVIVERLRAAEKLRGRHRGSETA